MLAKLGSGHTRWRCPMLCLPTLVHLVELVLAKFATCASCILRSALNGDGCAFAGPALDPFRAYGKDTVLLRFSEAASAGSSEARRTAVDRRSRPTLLPRGSTRPVRSRAGGGLEPRVAAGVYQWMPLVQASMAYLRLTLQQSFLIFRRFLTWDMSECIQRDCQVAAYETAWTALVGARSARVAARIRQLWLCFCSTRRRPKASSDSQLKDQRSEHLGLLRRPARHL